MTADASRFEKAIAAIDAANSADPNVEERDGTRCAKELCYGRAMTAWLQRLYPQGAEALQLAARAQHIRRWEIPRASYPEGRKGYHAWRTTLYRFHADQAAAILRDVGYDAATIARVTSLLRKENLKQDAEAQALEDVACLVFLEDYFADFARSHEAEKLITILRKTWRKMSATGQAAALLLDLSPEARALVARALATTDGPPPSSSGR